MEQYRDTPYAIIDTHPSNEDLDQMLEFVESVLEARYRYGYLTIASIIVMLLTGSRIVIGRFSTATCSGMSSETLTRRGLIFPVPPSHMTPEMLGRKFRVTYPLYTLSPHLYISLLRPHKSTLRASESVLVADYPQSLKRNIEAFFNQGVSSMDTQISKLFKVITGEYYCSNCSTHFEMNLTSPKPHQVCGEYGSHAFLKVLTDKEVPS